MSTEMFCSNDNNSSQKRPEMAASTGLGRGLRSAEVLGQWRRVSASAAAVAFAFAPAAANGANEKLLFVRGQHPFLAAGSSHLFARVVFSQIL